MAALILKTKEPEINKINQTKKKKELSSCKQSGHQIYETPTRSILHTDLPVVKCIVYQK